MPLIWGSASCKIMKEDKIRNRWWSIWWISVNSLIYCFSPCITPFAFVTWFKLFYCSSCWLEVLLGCAVLWFLKYWFQPHQVIRSYMLVLPHCGDFGWFVGWRFLLFMITHLGYFMDATLLVEGIFFKLLLIGSHNVGLL